ncbi:DUF4118 domain-containing protein, partial [Phenylobacterium sp.]|uniref:DUF4118 domain-containing protein n=1 Tax=Phenylobacterium sp. TaxID=1871053 RepID=UPI0035C7C465
VGKSRRRRPFRPSLAEALLIRTTGAALHVVTEGSEARGPATPAKTRERRADWRQYFGTLGLVAAAFAIAHGLDRYIQSVNLAMVFMLAVLVSGLAFGLWPAVAAAAASAFLYNFFFLEPRLTVWIGHPADVLTFAVFFAVALTTGWLTGRVRDQARLVARRASAISAVLAATRRLSSAPDAPTAARALAEQLAAATNGDAIVLTPTGEDLQAAAASEGAPALSPGDMAAARWAWERGEPAGAGTGTMPALPWVFRPLQGVKARAGVAGVSASAVATEDGERFVAALLDQGAVALERAEFAASAADAEALRRTDRLRAALLNSVSHDLRTPLSTVLGSVTTLIDYGAGLSAAVRDDLLQSIREEAERLSRYVGDLLDMTRLEGGALIARRDWLDARDVLRAAVERVRRRLGGRKIAWDFPDQVTLVMADPTLLEQALVNILENAIAYSPDGSTIEVAAYEDHRNVVISIEDEGRGIPTHDLERVFEKFRRLDEASDRGKGAGLGLAISKGFIEVMDGRIAAASPIHDGRGTRILISLPKTQATPEGLL